MDNDREHRVEDDDTLTNPVIHIEDDLNNEDIRAKSQSDKRFLHNETSILKLLSDTMSQQYSVSLNNLTVPEFSGLPREDVHSFLGKFKSSTIGLTPELKCQSLLKALKGIAKIWSKSNIKEDIQQANWKSIKDKIIARFGEPDRVQNYRRRLNRMTYKESESTLLVYVEAFIDCYSKAYTDHKPEDAIQAIELNLPTKIIGHLNQMDDHWNEYKDLTKFYNIIAKLETKILPYDTREVAQPSNIVDAVQKMLIEFRNDVFKQNEPKAEVAQIALLDQRNCRDLYRNNKDLIIRRGDPMLFIIL